MLESPISLITWAVRHQVLKWARFVFYIIFWVLTSGLISWCTTNHHILCSWAKYSWADDMVQVAKNKMWESTLLA